MPLNFLRRIRNRLGLRRPPGRPALVHHGIQRSGTNYLNVCLKRLDAPPLNAVDPERNCPRHKHFRWQAEKGSIPHFIKSQYGNDLHATNVEELNELAGYPAAAKHLVLQKSKDPWLVSICNWGLACDWFPDVETALRELPTLARDYDHYYRFWEGLAAAQPDRVAVLRFERLRSDLGALTSSLDALNVPYRVPRDFNGKVDAVPMSPPDRKVVVTLEDVKNHAPRPPSD